MEKLAEALVKCMDEITNVQKNSTVGQGSYSYKGVSDKDVKVVARTAMINNGLSLIPTGIQRKMTVDRWTDQGKNKQNVFVEVITTYKLLHVSGQSIEVTGYGHGMDTADKAAGKATTYALKYALLYLLLIPTGDIDDTDKHHSEEMPVPPKRTPQRAQPTPSKQIEKPFLNPGTEAWQKVVAALKGEYTIGQVKLKYQLTPENQELLLDQAAS